MTTVYCPICDRPMTHVGVNSFLCPLHPGGGEVPKEEPPKKKPAKKKAKKRASG